MEGSELRVSDQQRERAAEQLREHFAAGRLTEDEFSERVQSAYSSRTESQLRQLLSDLPRLPASPQQAKAELVARRRHLQRRLLQEAGGGLGVFAICTIIWFSSGGHEGHSYFWPVWVLLIVAIPLIRNGWRLYGPAPQLDRVERELEHRTRRGDRHQHRGGRRSR